MIEHTSPRGSPSDGEIDLHSLDRDRQLSRLRLKSTFEDIFTKYEFDFSNVGDEIDLDTEEVIVDNGHLSGMLDEHDVGRAVADQCLRCFTRESSEDAEREQEQVEEGEGEGQAADEKRLGSVKHISRSCDGEFQQRRQCSTSDSFTLNGERRTVPYQPLQSTYGSQMSIPGQLHANIEQNNVSNFESAALQALSSSIACQITQFLSSMRQSMAPQRPTVWENVPPLPRKEIKAPKPLQRQILERDHKSTPSLQNKSLWALPTVRQKRKRHSSDFLATGEDCISEGQSERLTNKQIDRSEMEKTPGSLLSKSSPIFHKQVPQEDDSIIHGDNRFSYSANTKRRLIQPRKDMKSRHHYSREDDDLIYDLRLKRKQSWDDIEKLFPCRDRESLRRRFYKIRQYKSRVPASQSDSERNNDKDDISIVDETPLPAYFRHSSPQVIQLSRSNSSPKPIVSLSVEIDNAKTTIPNSTSDTNDSSLRLSSISGQATKGNCSLNDQNDMVNNKASTFQFTTPRKVNSEVQDSTLKDSHTRASRGRSSAAVDPNLDDELSLGYCQLPQLSSSKRRRTREIPDIWESEDELAMLEMSW